MVRRLAWVSGTMTAGVLSAVLGVGPAGSAAWALAAAAIFSLRSDRAVFAAGTAALALSALGRLEEASALTAMAGLLACLAAGAFPARAAGCISVLLAGQSGGIAHYWAFVIAAVAALAPLRAGMRRVLVPVILACSVAVFGIPERMEPHGSVVQESFSRGRPAWPGTSILDRGNPELVLRVPPGSTRPFVVRLEGGGTRDSLPIGLAFGETFASAVPAGVSMLRIPSGEGLVTICLARPYRPFEHPVIIVGPGGAE